VRLSGNKRPKNRAKNCYPRFTERSPRYRTASFGVEDREIF